MILQEQGTNKGQQEQEEGLEGGGHRHEHVGRGGVDAGGDQDVGALLLLVADGCVPNLRREGRGMGQIVCLSFCFRVLAGNLEAKSEMDGWES